MKFNKLSSGIAAAMLAFSGSAFSGDLLKMYEDGSKITLSGKVKQVKDDRFVLDHGQGHVDVDVDDWDWGDSDLKKFLKPGDKITVSGRVDSDWFSGREIEADNVFIDSDYVYYYTIDTYPAYTYYTYSVKNDQEKRMDLEEGAVASIRGKITKIDGDEFHMTSKGKTIKVDVSELGYDPMDNVGLQKLKVGDRVYVSGEVDDGFFEQKEIEADYVITIKDARGNNKVASN